MGASRPDGLRPEARPGSPVTRPSRTVLLALALGLPLALGRPVSAGSQELAEPRLQGRVVLGDSTVTTGTVVLHRVTSETAGEIDSVRVGPDGSFTVELPSVPDPGGRGEVYFASIEYLGILYFGPAVHSAVQLDSLYLLPVYDTVTSPAEGTDLPLAMRYIVLEPGSQLWTVTDLFQVENPGQRTLVAAEGGFVWSYPLPPGAVDLEVGGDDVAPDAVTFGGGEIRVSAPLPPGRRQYVVRYRLGERFLDVSLPGAVRAVELLVPEPSPPLEVVGLTAAGPVEMEPGVTFRRFTGSALRDHQVQVTPGRNARGFQVQWLAVVIAVLLAGAGLWAFQRRPAPAAATVGAVAPTATELREALLLEVARLDESLEQDGLEPGRRSELEAGRAALVERLRSLG